MFANTRWPLAYLALFGFTCTAWAGPSTRPSRRPPQGRPATPSKTLTKSQLQKDFFHIHQAIGHLESWLQMRRLKRPHCRHSLARARQHFNKAKGGIFQRPHHPMHAISVQLKGALKAAQAANVGTVESLRMRLHESGKKHKLIHKIKWRNEFARCRSARSSQP